MSDIRNFSNFKDWDLILLIGGNFATQINLNATVAEQTKTTAVQEVKIQVLQSDVKEIQASMKQQKISNNDEIR